MDRWSQIIWSPWTYGPQLIWSAWTNGPKNILLVQGDRLWGSGIKWTELVGDDLSRGTTFWGTICLWGPNLLGSICPWGPILWGSFVQEDRKWGTGSLGIKCDAAILLWDWKPFSLQLTTAVFRHCEKALEKIKTRAYIQDWEIVCLCTRCYRSTLFSVNWKTVKINVPKCCSCFWYIWPNFWFIKNLTIAVNIYVVGWSGFYESDVICYCQYSLTLIGLQRTPSAKDWKSKTKMN